MLVMLPKRAIYLHAPQNGNMRKVCGDLFSNSDVREKHKFLH